MPLTPPLIADFVLGSGTGPTLSCFTTVANPNNEIVSLVAMTGRAPLFACVLMRAVRHAVKLIAAVVTQFEVVRYVIRRITVRPVVDLESITRPDEGGVDDPMNEMELELPILFKAHT